MFLRLLIKNSKKWSNNWRRFQVWSSKELTSSSIYPFFLLLLHHLSIHLRIPSKHKAQAPLRDFSVKDAHDLRVVFCWKSRLATSSPHVNAFGVLHWQCQVHSVHSVTDNMQIQSKLTTRVPAKSWIPIFNFSTESACCQHARQLSVQMQRTRIK